MNTFHSMTRLTLLVLALATAPAFAQTGEIHGQVVDAETDEPVVGATVRIDGTGRGVAADLEGRFQIALQGGDHWLLVTAVGYAPARIHAHDGHHLTVRDPGPAMRRMAHLTRLAHAIEVERVAATA